MTEKHDLLVAKDESLAVGRPPLPHAVRLSLSRAANLEAMSRCLERVKGILVSDWKNWTDYNLALLTNHNNFISIK